MKRNVCIYVPSYCLSYGDPNRLTDMSLQTMMKGIEVMKEEIIRGNKPLLIISTSRPILWEKEAELKKKMVLEAGLGLNDLIIIPAMEDSFDEAERIKEIISDHNGVLIVVAERWHAPRVASSLKMALPPAVTIKVVKVKAKIERHLDTSWLRSFLCSSTTLNYILWQWFFGLIGPLMSRRQKKKRPAT